MAKGAYKRNDSTKVKSENGPKNELSKSALLLFFGAIIIELVRAGASVAVFGRRAFFYGELFGVIRSSAYRRVGFSAVRPVAAS
jgi:hypothetical protein